MNQMKVTIDTDAMTPEQARAYVLDHADRITEEVAQEYVDPFEKSVIHVCDNLEGRRAVVSHQITQLETEDECSRRASRVRSACSRVTMGLIKADPRSRTEEEEKSYRDRLAELRRKKGECDVLLFVEDILKEQAQDSSIEPVPMGSLTIRPGQDAILTPPKDASPLFRFEYGDADGRRRSMRLRIDEKDGRNMRDYYHTLSAEDPEYPGRWQVLGEDRGVRMSNILGQSFMEVSGGSVKGNPPGEDGTVQNIVRLKFEKNGKFMEAIDNDVFADSGPLADLHFSLFLFLAEDGEPRYVLRLHQDTPNDMSLSYEGEGGTDAFKVIRPS